MARWFSSDLHLGHRNIIEYSRRPFADVDHMNTHILSALAAIPAGDELWLLGDLALGRAEDTVPLLERLSGPIVLVAGNHDRCFGTGPKADAWAETYANLRPVAELHRGNTTLTLTNGLTVQVSHFPYPDPSYDPRVAGRPDRYAPYRPVDDGSWLLCGHVHEKWRQRGRVINVGIDAWAGQPVPEEALIDLIAAGPQDLDPLPWATA